MKNIGNFDAGTVDFLTGFLANVPGPTTAFDFDMGASSANQSFNFGPTYAFPPHSDAFLTSVDLSGFDFMNYGPDAGGNSGSMHENQTAGPGEDDNADGDCDDRLEYIGPPYAGPAPLYDAMDVSVCFVSRNNQLLNDSKVNQSGFNTLSQELPPFPPLPASYISDDHPDEHTTDVFDDHEEPLAPQDIDLELGETNILAGKRKRTQSTRAADATAAGPTKRSSHQRSVRIHSICSLLNWYSARKI
jgi:hypothetical protein